MLSPEQVNTIFDLVSRQLVLFAGVTMGPKVLSEEDRRVLIDNKVDINRLYSEKEDLVLLNFQLGMLSNILGDQRTQGMTYDQLVKFVSSGQHIPLTEIERATVDSIKMQSFADIKSARGKIFQDVNNVVSNQLGSSRADQEEFIKERLAQGSADRKSRKAIARDIARLTGDWSRNFDKSVQYISHSALNEGRAAAIMRRYDGGGKEARIYFQVQPNACDSCVKAYLTKGRGSEPIIFTMSEIIANGSNIGRKQKEWLPTLGAMHPHCRCLATEYIDGSEWDGVKFVGKKYHSPINRRKIHIVFNGESYHV